jgi:hypothetical protein
MSNARGGWKIWGLSSVLGAVACSGHLLEVGDLNGAGGHVGVIESGGLGSTEVANGSGGAGTLGRGGLGGAGAATAGASARTEPSTAGSSTAGSNAVASAGSDAAAGAAGAGDQPDLPALICPDCTLISGADVRAVASDGQKVFWVEYGTVDSTTYKHGGDGRLLARDLDGGEPTVLATSLAGPEWIAVSSDHVYVFIDRRGLDNFAGGVLRVPISGGSAELVQELPSGTPVTQPFASSPDYEYWNTGSAVYRIARWDGASAEIFSTRSARTLFADDIYLYLSDYVDGTGTWTIPLGGGAERQLSSAKVDVMQLEGDYLYGIDVGEHGLPNGTFTETLSRMPKTGGDWTPLATAHGTWSRLNVSGDYYFMDEPDNNRRLLRGSLSNPDAPLVLLASEPVPLRSKRYPSLPTTMWYCWQLTRVGIFFADEQGLHLTPALP